MSRPENERRVLTADAAVFLVGAVSASVPAAAGYRVGTTPAVVAPERAESRGDPAAIARPARSPRLVAAVPARHHRVAELVSRQALAVVASERTLGTLCANESREAARENSGKTRDRRMLIACRAKRVRQCQRDASEATLANGYQVSFCSV